MADRHSPHDRDRELEEMLTSHRDRIAYPEMADSVSEARRRIEDATRPVAVGSSTESTPFDDWNDESEERHAQGQLTRIDRQAPGKLRQALTLAAATLAIFIVGGLLIAVLPDVIDDEGQSGAVLGPDTTGYEFAGTIGGPMIPNEPVDVAVDSQGNIYAADIATRSVHKFDSEGAHVASWTAEDAEVGAFIQPWSLAIEGDTLYVLDQRQRAIYLFDRDGGVLDSWHLGDPDDQESLYTGIDVNQHGHMYVANANGGSIVIYEGNGTHIADIQITDDPLSGGERPLDVAVRDDGRIFYTSFAGNAIHVLDTTGNPLDSVLSTEFAELGIPDPPSFYGITLGADGFLYAMSDQKVTMFETDGLEHVAGWDFNTQHQGSAGFPTQGISVDSDGVIYVADTTNQRIIGYAIGSTDQMLEIEDTRSGRVVMPGGLEVDDEGKIHVIDVFTMQVYTFTPDGDFVTSLPWEVERAGPRLTSPTGDVALTGEHIYILDGPGQAAIKLTREGEHVLQWYGGLLGDDAWSRPRSIHVGPNGSVFVLDDHMQTILQYSSEGEFLGVWVGGATAEERSSGPISMDIQGDIVYVAYPGGSTPGIRRLDLDGNILEQVVEFTRTEERVDTFPSGLAVAPTGDLFTVDPFARTVRWYSPEGELKSEWGLDVGKEDAFTFVNIAVSNTGTVYVSDGDTRQILVYEPVSD